MNQFTEKEKENIINNILNKVDEEDKIHVEDYLSKTLPYMNQHTYQVFNAYYRRPYNKIDNYLKTVLFSTHFCWYCYMDDSEFKEDYKKITNEHVEKLTQQYPLLPIAWNRLKTHF
jgi:hypothetical protein